MPNAPVPVHHVFVLRLWLERTDDGLEAWRASLLSPFGHRRQFFNNPEQLSAYLASLPLQDPGNAEELA